MGLLEDIINFILHLDTILASVINQFGIWTYLILFLTVFSETGFVVTPFLPGDSLLFVSGTFAATGVLNLEFLFLVFSIAAIAGDTANYWIGNYFGPKIFKREDSRFLKREYLERSKDFYEKHGGKTIIIARFIPIIRTFAPFVAGMGKMKYPKFITYNILGGLVWVSVFLLGGYFFGNIQAVRENLSAVIIVIILLSLGPIFIKFIQSKIRPASTS